MPYFDLQEIRRAVPVEYVLAFHGVSLRGGRARCPLPGVCEGKHGASFAVYREGQTWRCHRCNRGGSVFDLLELLEGLTTGHAIRRAASLAGVSPSDTPTPRGPKPEDPKRQRRRLVGEAFRTVAAMRDELRRIARAKTVPIETRADALAGVVLCNRKLDLLLVGEPDAVATILAEFEVNP